MSCSPLRLFIFDRHHTCLLDQNYSPGDKNTSKQKECMQLVRGLCLTLRGLLSKLSVQSQGGLLDKISNPPGIFFTIKSKEYTVQYYEPPTGWRFVFLHTSISTNQKIKTVLPRLYSQVFVPLAIVTGPLLPIFPFHHVDLIHCEKQLKATSTNQHDDFIHSKGEPMHVTRVENENISPSRINTQPENLPNQQNSYKYINSISLDDDSRTDLLSRQKNEPASTLELSCPQFDPPRRIPKDNGRHSTVKITGHSKTIKREENCLSAVGFPSRVHSFILQHIQ